MTISLSMPLTHEMKPRITVVGVGGAGGNAVNNMITSHLEGVEFLVCNTDAQVLASCLTERKVQLGAGITHGLGAGARPEIGRAAAEEALDEILDHLQGSHMVFITAGMGGGTGTGASPVIARAVREQGILTVAVVTKPFHFEGAHRMRIAEAGIEELQQYVDTLIVIPNQNLFRLANERTTFADAFKMADEVLHMGVRGVTDLIVMPGQINLDFADIRTVMSEMGKAMMGTGEAEGERRAIDAAEAAISNPLLDEVSMRGARGVLINITGSRDMTLFEVDAAANRIREEVDPDANIIFGSTLDESMEGRMRVSVVATGIEAPAARRGEAAEAAGETPGQGAAARSFKFQPQVHRPQPFPHVGPGTPAREPSPATFLRQANAARGEEKPQPSTPSFAGAGLGRPAAAPVNRPIPRSETRPFNLIDRFRGLARGRGPEQELPEHEPAAAPEPAASAPTPASARDEIGDVPAFLRRERVDS